MKMSEGGLSKCELATMAFTFLGMSFKELVKLQADSSFFKRVQNLSDDDKEMWNKYIKDNLDFATNCSQDVTRLSSLYESVADGTMTNAEFLRERTKELDLGRHQLEALRLFNANSGIVDILEKAKEFSLAQFLIDHKWALIFGLIGIGLCVTCAAIPAVAIGLSLKVGLSLHAAHQLLIGTEVALGVGTVLSSFGVAKDAVLSFTDPIEQIKKHLEQARDEFLEVEALLIQEQEREKICALPTAEAQQLKKRATSVVASLKEIFAKCKEIRMTASQIRKIPVAAAKIHKA